MLKLKYTILPEVFPTPVTTDVTVHFNLYEHSAESPRDLSPVPLSEAVLFYTLDETDPLHSETRSLYDPTQPLTLPRTGERYTLKAVAHNERFISNVVEAAIQTVDSESDPDEYFTYSISGVPEGDLVENSVYNLTLNILSGSGTYQITESSPLLVGLDAGDPVEVAAGDVVNFSFMPTAYRTTDIVSLALTFVNAHDNKQDTYEFTKRVVSVFEEHPPRGNSISWVKAAGAVHYRVYRDNVLIVELPHDPAPRIRGQWYLDLQGNTAANYSVSYINEDGEEVNLPTPIWSPVASISTCQVYGRITDLVMAPASELTLYIRIKEVPKLFGNTLINKGSIAIHTDARGYFDFIVPGGAEIVINCDEVGLNKTLLIPKKSTAELSKVLTFNKIS